MSNKIVFGKVTDSSGRAVANVKVAIFYAGMREWLALAETFTDRDGKYEVSFSQDAAAEGTGIAVKVSTAKTNTEIFRSSIDEVRFNASEREEINVKIIQPLPKEDVEFTFLVSEVMRLAKQTAIAYLQENDEHRDITFLSKELGAPAEKIEHLVMAHRLAKSTKIKPAFFYGLFRMNTLIGNNTENGNVSQNLAGHISIIEKKLRFTSRLLQITLKKQAEGNHIKGSGSL